MIRGLQRAAAAGLMVMLAAFAADAQSERGPSVRRTTMLVEDLARSVDFYQRLGFVKHLEQMSQEIDQGGVIGATELPLTSEPRSGHLVVMRGREAQSGMIGLLSYTRPPLASARSNLMGLGTGDIIVVVEVPDIQQVYGNLQQIGTRFHRTPGAFTMAGPDGSSVSGRNMLVYDPDGHMVEVIQPDGPRR